MTNHGIYIRPQDRITTTTNIFSAKIGIETRRVATYFSLGVSILWKNLWTQPGTSQKKKVTSVGKKHAISIVDSFIEQFLLFVGNFFFSTIVENKYREAARETIDFKLAFDLFATSVNAGTG